MADLEALRAGLADDARDGRLDTFRLIRAVDAVLAAVAELADNLARLRADVDALSADDDQADDQDVTPAQPTPAATPTASRPVTTRAGRRGKR